MQRHTVGKAKGKKILSCGLWESLGEMASSPVEEVELGDPEGWVRDLIIWWIIGRH